MYQCFRNLRHHLTAAACGLLAFSLCACSAASSASSAAAVEETRLIEDSLYVLEADSVDTPLNGQGTAVAFVADAGGTETGPDSALWRGVQAFADTFGYTAQLYQTEESTPESRENALRTAAESGAAVVVCRGDEMAAALYNIQNNYPSVAYLCMDAEPHSQDYTAYETASNTHCVMFSEEQAGYLAGYAAVMEGKTRLGFVGAEAMPDTVRYCTGFLQGVDAAAQSQGVQAALEVWYVGSEDAVDVVAGRVSEWASDGVEAVMAAGDGTLEGCIQAVQGTGCSVIGTDWDSTAQDAAVLTSAMKNYAYAVQRELYNYFSDGGWGNGGGATERLTASENAVGLPQVNWRMNEFSQRAYERLYGDLHDGTVKVERLSDASNLPETPNVAVDILG